MADLTNRQLAELIARAVLGATDSADAATAVLDVLEQTGTVLCRKTPILGPEGYPRLPDEIQLTLDGSETKT